MSGKRNKLIRSSNDVGIKLYIEKLLWREREREKAICRKNIFPKT